MEEKISIRKHKTIDHITISMNEKGAKCLKHILEQYSYLNLSYDDAKIVHRLIANLEVALDEV